MTGLALLTLMDWMGFSPETAMERFRAVLAGRIRPATDVLAMRRRAVW
jgi:hypothetical protein